MLGGVVALWNRLAPVAVGQVRGMARGKVLVKAAWKGWPDRSKKGWRFARAIKDSLKKDQTYETKQEALRRLGLNKGRAADELYAKQFEQPQYVITSKPDR